MRGRWGRVRCRPAARGLERFRAKHHDSEKRSEETSPSLLHPQVRYSVSESLRVALLLDPLSLSLAGTGLRVKWASHAPELAREFLGRGYHVRGFGAPAGLIPRSSDG